MAITKILITDKQLKVPNIASALLEKEVDVMNKKSGAPYIVGDDSFISVSHKKNFLVVAVSKNKVGVDIEKIVEKDTVFKVAGKYFGEKIPDNDYLAFYRSWTKKESLGKLCEKGITRKLLANDTACDFFVNSEGKTIYFNHFCFADYVVTVADYTNDVEFILDKNI